MVWVPHCAGILHCWPDNCLVSHGLYLRLTSMDIPFNESKSSIDLGTDVGDTCMFIPTELVMDGHAQVFGTVNFLQGVSLQCVAGLPWLPLIGYVYHSALLWVELYLPQVFPVLECWQVPLQLLCICFAGYFPVEQGFVCTQPYIWLGMFM